MFSSKTYSFIRPPENWFPAEFWRQHGAVTLTDKWIELKICWSLSTNLFLAQNSTWKNVNSFNLRHRNLKAVGTCDNSRPVLSLALLSLSLAQPQFDYHRPLCNYCCCCYSSCCVCLKSPETKQRKNFSYLTLFKGGGRKNDQGGQTRRIRRGISIIMWLGSSKISFQPCTHD